MIVSIFEKIYTIKSVPGVLVVFFFFWHIFTMNKTFPDFFLKKNVPFYQFLRVLKNEHVY